jgi:cysteine synthase A
MKIYQNIAETVGNTPLVKINNSIGKTEATVLGKLEFYNPSSSIKDRIAVSMIDEAEVSGKLKPGGVIVEPTSGNTGLGLAMVAAARGYRLIITMPETMSIERKLLLEHLGAEVISTPGEAGMAGAVEQATQLVAANDNFFMPQQFCNKANPKIHAETTAVEIWDDTDGKVDIFVAGVGTGGTVTGVGQTLKKRNPEVKIVAVEPEKSAVLSGGQAGKHSIQGIGAGFIPDVLDRDLLDEVIKVADDEALHMARLLAQKDGILCGISAGANVYAAMLLAKRPENVGKTIVTIICDTGERYMSTMLFQ